MTDNTTYREQGSAILLAAIMVVSMIGVGAFAGGAAAAVDTADRTIQDAELEPGETTQVTVDVTPDAATEIDITENFSPAFADVTVTDDDGATIATATNAGDQVAASYGTTEGVTLVYEVQIPSDAAVDDEFTLSGTATDRNDSSTVDISGDSTITVVDDSGSDGGDGGDGGDGSAPNSSTENRDEADGDVFVTNGETVFQGEEDIVFYNADLDQEFQASELAGTSGSREGTPLQLPIPEDEQTGTYDTNGPSDAPADFSTTVVEPRITTSEVQLNGDDIEQIATDQANNDGDSTFGVQTDYNFEEAENVEITVEDPSGADITNEVLTDEDAIVTDGELLPLDMSSEDAGEYTIVFEGEDDLDFDSVIQEYTFELTNDDTLNVELNEDPVTQGTNNDFTISGGTNGNYHLVAIEEDDFRSDDITDNVFRNVGDTTNVGFADEDGEVDNAEDASYAYAVVEIDGTQGVGSIRTETLDDSSVDLFLYSAEGDGEFYDRSGNAEEDDIDFDVEEGEITIDDPTGTYTVGSEVDINGSAASADEVVIFARDNDDYEPVDVNGAGVDIVDDDGNSNIDEYTITVDSDDTFEEEDVVLSQANDIYSFEGSYDIGVVDAADLDVNDEFSNGQLSTSDFSQASSDRATIQVQSGDLSGNFSTVNGQIAQVDNTIDVDGTAAGQDNVVVAFVDERGNTVAREVSVDSDDTLEEDDIGLGELSQGTVSAHIISESRDGTIGDGDDLPNLDNEDAAPAATTSGLVEYIEDLGTETSGSGDQVRSRIVSNTVEADGSDDLIINSNFRLNDATLSIRDVYPEEAQAEGVNPVAVGETAVVVGDTNRNSDDSAVSIEILDENENSVATASTDEWGNDGQFSASLDTSGLETGTYIVEADDGESTDRVNIELVDEREDPADGEDGADDGADNGTDMDGADGEDGTDEDGADGEDGADDGADNGTDGDDGGDTEDSTPGFGALVALVALIAAALLATRRND